MSFRILRINSRSIYVHKAILEPKFGSKTILVGNTWDYVTMWLRRRKNNEEALHYWEQARHFADATKGLPKTSAPLTTYYCFLNASKALLAVRKQKVQPYHGVSGCMDGNKAALSNEIVNFKKGGVLSALCTLLGESTKNEEYTLKALLYNLPYIHRAFCKTYTSSPELFIPITNPRFVVKNGSNEAWFCTDVSDRTYQTQHTVNKLPYGYERDKGISDSFVIRRKMRFSWVGHRGGKQKNVNTLRRYHMKVREHVYYIHGATRLWYLKRNSNQQDVVRRSSLTLTFAAMHRLSALARYSPLLLARHFECQHNWLLSEFLETALGQFLDEISSEITGEEFMIPGIRKVN